MQKYTLIYICFVVSALIFSCKKKSETPVPYQNQNPTQTVDTAKASLKISFSHFVNNNPLIFNVGKYTNLNGDTFKVNTLKYYISNVILKMSDGTYYTVPESYYLIDASATQKSVVTINNIPVANYSSITLSIGVDKNRNHSGAQTGALDENNGTIWDWADGYKFFILLGSYKSDTMSSYKAMAFQVGSDENFKTISFDSTSVNWTNLKMVSGKTTAVVFKTNVEEAFQSPKTIDFTKLHDVSFDSNGMIIADNYANMLSLSQIINP